VWMYRNVLSRGPGGTYVLGHAIDITERVEAERKVRQSEAERSRQQALLEQRDTLAFLANFSDRLAPLVTFEELIDVVREAPVPFLADWTTVHMVEDDGSIRFVSGVRADQGSEPPIAAVGTATDIPDASSHLSSVAATGRLEIFSLTGGTASTIAMIPLVIDARVKSVLSLVSTTEHRFTSSGSLIIEDVARRIGLALDRIQLYREAQEANRLKDEFLGTLSHELRTPLNAIFGWSRILRTRNLDERTAHGIEVIERNAEAQIRLIEEVLDVSRIIRGKMTVAMEPLDMAAIVRATIEAVRPAVHAKQIRLEERIGETALVCGDNHRLQQVFSNLLSNALKFTHSDGAITVTLRTMGESVEFEIADTGVGIRRDVLPVIFDRFRQADSSTTRRYGGLGLGLAIVKHIVELHRGTVRATSAGEGQGATFTVRLPVFSQSSDRARGKQPVHAGEPPQAAMPSGLSGRTILVVEDHEDARDLIVGILEGAGARVLAASTVREAVDRAANVRPDVLVADLGLPGEDGYVLLARMRERFPGIPALALTAYARATDRDRVLAAGFQQHVIKPVDPDELLRFVAALL